MCYIKGSHIVHGHVLKPLPIAATQGVVVTRTIMVTIPKCVDEVDETPQSVTNLANEVGRRTGVLRQCRRRETKRRPCRTTCEFVPIGFVSQFQTRLLGGGRRCPGSSRVGKFEVPQLLTGKLNRLWVGPSACPLSLPTFQGYSFLVVGVSWMREVGAVFDVM